MRYGILHYYYLALAYIFFCVSTVMVCAIPFMLFFYVDGVTHPGSGTWGVWTLPFIVAYGGAAFLTRKASAWHIKRLKALPPDDPE